MPFVQSAFGSTNAGANIVLTLNNVNGTNTLHGFATTLSTTTPPTTPSDNAGQAWSTVQSFTGALSNECLAQTVLGANATPAPPKPGTHVVTWTAPVSILNACLCEWDGNLQNGAVDQKANQTDSSTAVTTISTPAVTPSVANGTVFVIMAEGGSSGAAGISHPPAGYSAIGVQQADGSSMGFECAGRDIISAVPQAATWNWTGGAAAGSAQIITYRAPMPASFPPIRRIAPSNRYDEEDEGMVLDLTKIDSWF